MTYSYLKKINEKKRKKVIDLTSDDIIRINVRCKEGNFVAAPNYNKTKTINFSKKTCNKTYYLDGDEVYVYLSDKKVYLVKTSIIVPMKAITTYNSAPTLVKILYEGKSKLLIISSEGSCVADNTGYTEVNVPVCDCAFVFKDMLFLGKDNQIRFSARNNYTDFTSSLDGGGYINLPANSGKILDFAELYGELYVICQKRIFKIIPYDGRDDYKVVQIKTGYINISEGTVASSQDKIMFISDLKPCVFEGATVKHYDSILGKFKTTISAGGGVFNNYYTAKCYTERHGNTIYCKDFVSGDEFFLQDSVIIVKNSPYGINTANNEVLTFSEKGRKYNYIYMPEIDLGTTETKFITNISLFTSENTNLCIEGKFGSKNYTFPLGHQQVQCALESDYFYFYFESSNTNFQVKKLIVEYVIRGE